MDTDYKFHQLTALVKKLEPSPLTLCIKRRKKNYYNELKDGKLIPFMNVKICHKNNKLPD